MSEAKHTEYTIKSLEDFYKIPEDKIDECLKDFKVWLELGRAINEFQEMIGLNFIERAGFVWIDDNQTGVRNIQISVQIKE